MKEYIITIDDSKADPDGGMPIKDKREVVRCRDCKFYQPKEGAMLSCKFEYHDFTQWKLAEPDGFCAWGEKVIGGKDGVD